MQQQLDVPCADYERRPASRYEATQDEPPVPFNRKYSGRVLNAKGPPSTYRDLLNEMPGTVCYQWPNVDSVKADPFVCTLLASIISYTKDRFLTLFDRFCMQPVLPVRLYLQPMDNPHSHASSAYTAIVHFFVVPADPNVDCEMLCSVAGSAVCNLARLPAAW